MNLKQFSHFLDLIIMLLLWWLVTLLSSCHHSSKQCTVHSTDASYLVDTRWWQTIDSMGLRIFVFDYDTEALALAAIADSNLSTIPIIPTKPTHARQYINDGTRKTFHQIADNKLSTIPIIPARPTHARQILIDGAKKTIHQIADTTKMMSQKSTTTVTTPGTPPSGLIPGWGGLLAIGFFAGAVAIIILVRARGR